MNSLAKQQAITSHPVYEKANINHHDLMKLINGDVAAIRMPNFCSQEICRKISHRLLTHPSKGFFNKASEIGRVGMAHFEIDSKERFERYHENAISNTQELRHIFTPYLSPIDKIRLLLEEIWPAGAQLEQLYGKKCFVGICRIMDPDVELLAHNDRLDRDSPDSMQAHIPIGDEVANYTLSRR